MDTLIVIPAHWASSRFPGKLLAGLPGKPKGIQPGWPKKYSLCTLRSQAKRARDKKPLTEFTEPAEMKKDPC